MEPTKQQREEYMQGLVEEFKAGEAARNIARGQCTLGSLITVLKRRDPKQAVKFDFCGCEPGLVDSYRGYYEQLAFEFKSTQWPKCVTVADVLADLEAALGKTFTGYKGGDFVMHKDTPLWVDNCGECNSTAVVGLEECDHQTIIATRYID